MGRKRTSTPIQWGQLPQLESGEKAVLKRGFRPGDTLAIEIQQVGPKGMGRAQFDALIGPDEAPRRITVDVRKAIPGDTVKVALDGGRGKKFTARRVEFIQPASHRQQAKCLHFGQREQPGKGCGGCTYQMLSYDDQLALKTAQVKMAMAAHGIDSETVRPTLPSPSAWHYRNKMEFSFGDDRARDFALGLYPSGWRNEVISLQDCFLQSEATAQMVVAIGKWCAEKGLQAYKPRSNTGLLRQLIIREGKRTGERMVEWVTSLDDKVLFDGVETPVTEIARHFAHAVETISAKLGHAVTTIYWTQHRAIRGERTRFVEHLLTGKPYLTERLELPEGRSLSFDIHPRAFFQPNTLGAELICATVLETARQMTGTYENLKVLDLYCGAGNLGLALAPYCADVLGIELNAEAVDNAWANARANGLANAAFIAGDVAEVLNRPEVQSQIKGRDLMVLDPPRSGLLPAAQDHITALAPKHIVYVSCNPDALGRDLRVLEAAGYQHHAIQPLDMFPQTYHVETIVGLTRR